MSTDEEIELLKKRISELEEKINKLESPIQFEISQKIKAKKSIADLLTDLKSEGFFDQPKLVKNIVDALSNKGYHYEPTSLTWTLQNLVRKGVLGRITKDNKWAYVKR